MKRKSKQIILTQTEHQIFAGVEMLKKQTGLTVEEMFHIYNRARAKTNITIITDYIRG